MADAVRRRELAAITPEPRLIVAFKGQEYPVLSITDLPYRRMLQILNPTVGASETLDQTVERVKAQIQEICPTMLNGTMDEWSYKELLAFLGAATEVDTPAGPTEAPPAAGESSTT